MRITRLVRNVRDKRKIAIYIDSKYTFSVLESILVRYRLYVGEEISEEKLAEIKEAANISYFKDRAIGLIARRPRSKKEIIDYLVKKTDENTLDKVLTALEEGKYVDDQEFANWWVKQRIEYNSKSSREIQKELYEKGISKEVIFIAMQEFDTEESDIESAKALVEKKKRVLKTKNLSKKEHRNKIIGYLQRKGFNWDVIDQIVNEKI